MLRRAQQALKTDPLAAAENTCRQLLGAAPDQRDARFLLSVSLFLQRRLGESLEHNRRLVAEHPAFAEGRPQQANLLETMGTKVAAATAYEELIGATPDAQLRAVARQRLQALRKRTP